MLTEHFVEMGQFTERAVLINKARKNSTIYEFPDGERIAGLNIEKWWIYNQEENSKEIWRKIYI